MTTTPLLEDKIVEMTEPEFIETYRAFKPEADDLHNLKCLLDMAEMFRHYGFRIKYFMDVEHGVLGYKPIKKERIGYLPAQSKPSIILE